jgi:uncharacterized protein (TIGR00288 family)
MSDDRKLAMFMDFENIVRGVKEAQYKQFEIKLVLERLVEKGKIMVKRAYADWNRYAEYKRPFHEHAIELIDVPQSRYSGKNSADIRMVVDAMDLAYAKQHVDSFALVSGDSDFSPLVSKLRENDRYVIGLGVKSSSSELLVGNCDEFIFYEDLIRESKKTTALRGLPEKKMERCSSSSRPSRPSSARTRTPCGAPWSSRPCSGRTRPSTSPTTGTRPSRSSGGGGEAADRHPRAGRQERGRTSSRHSRKAKRRR